MNTMDVKTVVHSICEGRFDPPLSKGDVSFLVDTILDTLATAVATTGHVTLRNFGTFRRTTRKGRTFKVVQEEVTVPDRDTVTFKPGVGLKKMIKNNR